MRAWVALFVGLCACGARSDLDSELSDGWRQSDGGLNGDSSGNGAPNPRGAASVAFGSTHACVVLGDGSVRCIGGNECGQLGRGFTSGPQSAAADVVGLPGPVRSLALGRRHSCALLQDGSMWCWGAMCPVSRTFGDIDWTADGVLGNLVSGGSLQPVRVHVASRTQQLSSSEDTICGLTEAGVISCWGYGFGPTPVDLPQLFYRPRTMVLGEDGNRETYVVVLNDSSGGTVFDLKVPDLTPSPRSWSYFVYDATVSPRPAVRLFPGVFIALLGGGIIGSGLREVIPAPTTVRSIVGGANYTCAVKQDGVVRCFGWGQRGELARELPKITATDNQWETSVDVSLTEQAVVLAGGAHDACAVLASGTVRCWGAGGTTDPILGFARDQFGPSSVAGFP